MTFVVVGKLSDIPRQDARCVVTPRGRIAVFRTVEDHVFALEDRCPHKAGPLSQGIVHGGAVTCPLHNMVISLETGQAMGADEGQVRTFKLEIDGETILIDIASLEALAA
jgi:nitrite reductase (NADH) small subunit